MTTVQIVKTLVTVNNNSHIQDYVHTQPTYEMTPGFKPFTLTFLLVEFVYLSYTNTEITIR